MMGTCWRVILRSQGLLAYMNVKVFLPHPFCTLPITAGLPITARHGSSVGYSWHTQVSGGREIGQSACLFLCTTTPAHMKTTPRMQHG